MCSHNRVPRRAPNEIGYGKIGYEQMKQCNSILQFPHMRAEKLSEERKGKPNFTFHTIYNLVVILHE